jgi:flagellar biosynthesis chaperone FliJ
MNAFRFRLERVLEWRRTRLELEENKFRRETAALAALDRARAELEAAGVKAEVQLRQSRTITGRELAALGEFRLLVRSREADVARQRAERAKSLAAQRAALLEAQRRCRLLERLKERRLEEWRLAGNKETDSLASETYLAQWTPGTK